MAYIIIAIDAGSDSIGQLNSQVQKPTQPHDEAVALRNYLEKMLAGAKDADFYVVTRDTDPVVATSGSGSQKVNYSLK